MDNEFVGRSGLAAILGVSEVTARALQAAGEIAPAMTIGSRPVFRAEDAKALRAKRDARRTTPRQAA